MADLVTRLRGCRADCAFWVGDSVEYRDRREAAPWHPTGTVLAPDTQSRDSETEGDRILRESIAAATAGQTRVRVDWRGEYTPGGQISVLNATRLRHHGPCPDTFVPGAAAQVTRLVLGDLEIGDLVRVTGIAPSGVLTVQAADGRWAEVYRSALAAVTRGR